VVNGAKRLLATPSAVFADGKQVLREVRIYFAAKIR
jgi:hypothetical protein